MLNCNRLLLCRRSGGVLSTVLEMDGVCAACAVYEACLVDYADLKSLNGPVWLLSKKYNIHDELDLRSLKENVNSILWFTYRKQFPEIGNTNLTSDVGWGCMHRCGQMLLAQAFTRRFLGEDWRWKTGTQDPTYLSILKMFNDQVECRYSLHNIALRGTEMDRSVGEWFGPNIVAQVLKKLVAEDEKAGLVIHVAMDNMVVTSEIKKLCKSKSAHCCDVEGCSQVVQKRNETSGVDRNLDEISVCQCQDNGTRSDWQPLLLVIPLRLGVTSITERCYFEKIKASFTVKGSLGFLGGRTNHASYFIGYGGDELVFLDPHTAQQYADDITSVDDTYHCECPGRMSFQVLDPSIALCFYCDTEESFDTWCRESKKLLLEPKEDAIFEILEKKPPMFACMDLDYPDDVVGQSLAETASERIYTSDEEFELLC